MELEYGSQLISRFLIEISGKISAKISRDFTQSVRDFYECRTPRYEASLPGVESAHTCA